MGLFQNVFTQYPVNRYLTTMNSNYEHKNMFPKSVIDTFQDVPVLRFTK